MKKIATVYHGKVIIIIMHYLLSHDIVVTQDVDRDVLTAYR